MCKCWQQNVHFALISLPSRPGYAEELINHRGRTALIIYYVLDTKGYSPHPLHLTSTVASNVSTVSLIVEWVYLIGTFSGACLEYQQWLLLTRQPI